MQQRNIFDQKEMAFAADAEVHTIGVKKDKTLISRGDITLFFQAFERHYKSFHLRKANNRP
jgi:hypothetical protein